jgi:hypothetical protein
VATKCKFKIPGHVILAEDKFFINDNRTTDVGVQTYKIKKNYVRD